MKPTPEWLQEFADRIKRHVLKGDYAGGLKIARAALAKYPKTFECRYQYAKLLGDWSDELPPARRKRCKAEAAKILKPLTRALRGRLAQQRFGVCLNYYYQAADFAGMVRFGRRFADRRLGLYAQALGACYKAKELHDARRPCRAYAKASIAAWKKYGLTKETYYFAHYSNALACALEGDGSMDGLLSMVSDTPLQERAIFAMNRMHTTHGVKARFRGKARAAQGDR